MTAKKGLTAKQEAYCLLRCPADGLSKSAAYRMVYDAQGMKPKTVNEAACRLDAASKIAARIKKLREPSVKRARVTLNTIIDHLNDAISMATDEGQASVIVAAARELGKISDLYPAERKDISLNVDSMVAELNAGRQRARQIDG